MPVAEQNGCRGFLAGRGEPENVPIVTLQPKKYVFQVENFVPRSEDARIEILIPPPPPDEYLSLCLKNDTYGGNLIKQ